MRPADQLAAFAADALKAGRSRSEISAALREAGWAEKEVAGALDAWAETDFTPPVPRPRPYVSAREAFLYGVLFLALAMTAWHITSLSFSLIDRWLPEPGRPDAMAIYVLRRMRWSIAALVTFAPVFFLLNARLGRAAQADPGRRRSGVRKWLAYLTLFLAIATLLGDFAYVVYALLNGDLTLRFGLKAAVVAVVAGAVFAYFSHTAEETSDAR